MQALIVLGTAGSGKTTFTANFSEWLSAKIPLKVCPVNLDPGASFLPYDPSYDIRELISVERLVVEERLGPNGAMVRAAELMVELSDDIASSLLSLDCEYLIIDTPGQMEIFAFRPTGRALCEKLARNLRLLSVYLGDYDPNREIEDLLSSALLAKILELKLGVKVIPLLNKSDLWEGKSIESLWRAALSGELAPLEGSGTYADALHELLRAVSSFRSPIRVIVTSAKYGKGFEEVFDLMNEVWCSCGDLT
ncbi:MAG: ATP/GTP-binding protein [Candidatus Korarchaeum sp.]|nr:ATP/GTP-binding protein [Candidatus Korarchaeum sp.]MDW8036248.1 ATP/GTP-binding protein [Candidatus Korarchaeum sp.]